MMEIAAGIHLLEYPIGGAWTGMVLLVRKKIALIDTAFEPAVDEMLYPYLAHLGLKPGDIDLVVNTHTHGDHIGGNAKLRRETAARFCAHHLAREKLRDPYFHGNKLRRHFTRHIPFQEVTCQLGSIELDVALQDGDMIDLGDSKLRVLHTPGHDTDEICLHEPDSGLLIAGDTLQGRGTGSSGVAFYLDLGEYRRSLGRVETLVASGSVETIVAGHPFVPTEGVIRRDSCPGFLQVCREATEEYDRIIRESLQRAGGEVDMARFTQKVLAQAGLTTTPTVPVLAYHTVAAHLREILPGWQPYD